MRVIREIDIHEPRFDAKNLREEIQMGVSVCGLVKRPFPIGFMAGVQPFSCGSDCLFFLLNRRCCRCSTPVPEDFRNMALCLNQQNTPGFLYTSKCVPMWPAAGTHLLVKRKPGVFCWLRQRAMFL